MKILPALYIVLAATLALAGMTMESPAAGHVSKFYSGKTVRLVVGYGRGGGYDTFARLLAPRLERETGIRVVVENKPGNGGLTVLNDAAHAIHSRTVLTVANVSAAVTAELLSLDSARFHFNDLVWLGGIASDDRVLLTAEGSGLEDWLSTPQTPSVVRWAALGRTDNLALSAALLSEAFGLKSRIITGYRGTSDAIAALLRGKVDAAVVSIETARQYLDTEGLSMAAVLSKTRSRLAPDVPTIYELDIDPAARKWIDYQVDLSTLGRALIVAPGTPRDDVKFFRTALQRILTSEEFIAAAAERGRSVRYTAAGDIENVTASILGPAAGYDKDELRRVVGAKYF